MNYTYFLLPYLSANFLVSFESSKWLLYRWLLVLNSQFQSDSANSHVFLQL